MADLIDREAFFKEFGLKNPAVHTSPDYAKGWNALYSLIAQMKPVDAEPVRHGRWIEKGWDGDFAWKIDGRGNSWRVIVCSECGNKLCGSSNTDYCQHCGAKMDKPEPEKTCDTCAYNDEPKTEQPCCGCVECCNWEVWQA